MARRAAPKADKNVTVDASPKVFLVGGPRHGEGFTLDDWRRITQERREWALKGNGRADWLDYKLTDETHEIRSTDKKGTSATLVIYKVARYTPKG